MDLLLVQQATGLAQVLTLVLVDHLGVLVDHLGVQVGHLVEVQVILEGRGLPAVSRIPSCYS